MEKCWCDSCFEVEDEDCYSTTYKCENNHKIKVPKENYLRDRGSDGDREWCDDTPGVIKNEKM